MLLQIDMSDEKPIYEQIKDSVIEAILTGAVEEGELLPSSRVLAQTLSVNMHTVGKAYTQLKQSGFVSVLRNKGVVINSPNSYKADQAYLELLESQLKGSIIEARCRGLEEEAMMELIKKYYK